MRQPRRPAPLTSPGIDRAAALASPRLGLLRTPPRAGRLWDARRSLSGRCRHRGPESRGYSCTSRMAVAPSPTAEATRLIEPSRASPAANRYARGYATENHGPSSRAVAFASKIDRCGMSLPPGPRRIQANRTVNAWLRSGRGDWTRGLFVFSRSMRSPGGAKSMFRRLIPLGAAIGTAALLLSTAASA